MEKTKTSSKKLLVRKATNRMVTKVRKMELLKMAVKMEKKHKQNPISRKKNRSLKKRRLENWRSVRLMKTS